MPELWKILLAAGAVVLALVLTGRELVIEDEPAAGRDVDRMCTLMGCTSAVGVEIGRLPATAHAVKLCVESMCNKDSVRWIWKYASNEIGVQLPEPQAEKPQSFRVRIAILDRRGRRIESGALTASTTLFYPNGKSCGDPCQRLEATFRDGRLRLAVSE